MGKMSNYGKSKLIDHVFKEAYTPVADLYLCLCTADPTVAGTGSSIVETDYTGYSRLSFTGGSKFNAAASRKNVQKAIFTFGQATEVGTSDISDWAICDAATNGNMLAFGSFNADWNVVSGNTPKIAVGEIEIEIESTVDSEAGFSTEAAHELLDHMFLNSVWLTPSADIHFGLVTAVVDDDDTLTSLTECATANGYAREPVPAISFDSASNGANTTNTDVEFDVPTGDLGTVTSLFVCNVVSGTTGILIAYDNENIVDQPVNTDDEVVVESGSFTVTLN